MSPTLRLKSFERDNTMFVKGVSTINHAIRVRNKLTINEYILLEAFIKKLESPKKNEPFTFGQIWVAVGLKPKTAQRIILNLRDKGFLYKDGEIIKVKESFINGFKEKSDFTEFWLISPKGNKAAAMRAYEKAIRVVTHDVLCKKYREYLEYCNQSGRFKLDTSTFLHPKNGYFDSEWVAEKVEEKKEEEKTTLAYNFFNGNNPANPPQ
jgi:hypothetical protein